MLVHNIKYKIPFNRMIVMSLHNSGKTANKSVIVADLSLTQVSGY